LIDYRGHRKPAKITSKNSDREPQYEPSFVKRISNKTTSVGRDVILGCQVKDLGSNYKVKS